MQQKAIIVSAAVLGILLFLGIGFFAGTKMSKKSMPQGTEVNADNTYQSGWDAAIKTLNESGAVPLLPEGMEVKNINGTVQAISGNNITLKVTTSGMISTPALLTRTVVIDANTKIIQLVSKDPTQLQKEIVVFNEKMKKQQAEPASDPKDLPYPVEMQEKKDVGIADIKVGQIINLQATEDIRNKQEFVATEIQIQAVVSAPLSSSATPEANAPPMPPASNAVYAPPAPAPAPSNMKNPPEIAPSIPINIPTPPAVK